MNKRLSVVEAAFQALQESGKPLHATEITDYIISNGLWTTEGKTPVATVAAQLYRDIKKRGAVSRFILCEPLTFALRSIAVADDLPASKLPTAPLAPKSDNRSEEKYSFTDSAEKILEKYGDKQPVHYREITEKALALGWLTSGGRTPEASMYAQITNEIKRFKRRGEQPRFSLHGKGYVGLARWMGRGLAFEIEQHNRKVRTDLHDLLHKMRWEEFEELIARLFAELGFEEIEITNRTKDGGIDVRGTLVVGEVIRTRMAIQVKRWKRNVQAPIVQQVRGSLGAHEQGLIITTSDFSVGAIKEAARPDATPVGLMNGQKLVLLLIENGLGVTRRPHELFEIDESLETDKVGNRLRQREDGSSSENA